MTKGVVHGVDFGHCAARHEGVGVNVRVSLHTQCIFTCTMYLYLHIIMYVFLYVHNLTAGVNVRISLRTQCISYMHMIMCVFL